MILVIGGGTAGLAVAIAAAEGGEQVRILEKSDRLGGTLWVSSGMISAGGTRRQRERGIDDSPDDHYADVIRIGGGTGRTDLARIHCDLAPGLIDWLDDAGFAFDPTTPVIYHGHDIYDRPRTYWGTRKARSILDVLLATLDPFLTHGTVQVVYSTVIDRLIVEGDRVVGAAAGTQEWRADAVVLTTGGFGNSPDLYRRFTPSRRLVSVAARTSTGDGLRLAEGLGAVVDGTDRYLVSFAGIEDRAEPGRHLQDDPDVWDPKGLLVPQLRPPWEIWVNARGERFMREDHPSADTRDRTLTSQPDQVFWVVFDQAILDAAPPLVLAWSRDRFDALAEEGVYVTRSDTVADLAARIAVPAATLTATIDAYNDAIVNGMPDPLGRDHRPRPITTPPYYAIRHTGVDLVSWPGVRVDTDLCVVRADGTAIPGLHACGEILGSAAFFGSAVVGGMLIGPALTLGRRLGQHLAT